MIGSLLLVLLAAGNTGMESAQDGREALSRSDFAGALAASGQLSNPLDAERLRMDTLYAAGDLMGALEAATRVMELDARGPHGAYMTSRLALDLGLVDRGREALAIFQERLQRARATMAPATSDWYAVKGQELGGQLERLEGQGAAENMALGRAKSAVGGAAIVILLAAFFMGRRSKSL